MLKVHLKSGETLCSDLSLEADAHRWLERSSDPSFQSQITALTVQENGVSYSMTQPDGFEHPILLAEDVAKNGKIKGATRVSALAGDVEILLTVHKSQRGSRIDVTRASRARYGRR